MLSKNVLKISLLSLVAFVHIAHADFNEELKAQLNQEYENADVETVSAAISNLEADINTKKAHVNRAKTTGENIFAKMSKEYAAITATCGNGKCTTVGYDSNIDEMVKKLKHQAISNVKISEEIARMETEKQLLLDIVAQKNQQEKTKLEELNKPQQ